MISSWGWATWKRAWDQFDPSASGWRERLVGAEAKRFDLGGRYDYSGMLGRQMNGHIDSWAIRWYYTVFARNGLALYHPRRWSTTKALTGRARTSGCYYLFGRPGSRRTLPSTFQPLWPKARKRSASSRP